MFQEEHNWAQKRKCTNYCKGPYNNKLEVYDWPYIEIGSLPSSLVDFTWDPGLIKYFIKIPKKKMIFELNYFQQKPSDYNKKKNKIVWTKISKSS